MQALAGIFFQVRTGHADTFDGAVFQRDVQVALANDRQFHLADLVALGQVRVEVVLAGKHVVMTMVWPFESVTVTAVCAGLVSVAV